MKKCSLNNRKLVEAEALTVKQNRLKTNFFTSLGKVKFCFQRALVFKPSKESSPNWVLHNCNHNSDHLMPEMKDNPPNYKILHTVKLVSMEILKEWFLAVDQSKLLLSTNSFEDPLNLKD